MIITMYVEADRKYQIRVPRKAKKVELSLLSPEDGWYVTIDGKKLPYEKIEEVPEEE